MPIINLPIPGKAGAFSKAIASVVTFDLEINGEGIDMEYVFGSAVKCPDEDRILTDLDEEILSDTTTIRDIPWSELKYSLYYDPYFDRTNFTELLDEDERERLIRLSEA